MYEWFDFNHFSWALAFWKVYQYSNSQSVVYKLCLEAQAAHLFLQAPMGWSFINWMAQHNTIEEQNLRWLAISQ